MSKFNFTKQAVIAAPVGVHYDTKQSGLCVTVTEHSRKYGIYVSVRGMPVRRSLGDVTGKSVESVRAEAAKLIAELRETPRQQARKATIQAVLDLYSAYIVDAGVKYPDYMNDVMERYWRALLPRQLEGITVLELTQAYRQLVNERGPSAGRYAINCLRTLFNYAESLELVQTNPARKVKTGAATARDVFLTDAEVATMRGCLDDMAPSPRAYFLLALLTGIRRDNLCKLRWEWVGKNTITIPKEESKNGYAMAIPLCAEAITILNGRRSLDPTYVFPSPNRPNHPITAVDDWIATLRKKMGECGIKKHWTTHDLRRTCATRLTAAGAPLPVVAQMLGHRSISSTPIYARASLDTVRDYLSRV